ncbi:MAG: Crp/Fnr family transcriptional regulator [Paludibacteraceae bacterium]|nr:Crp/Fnr family transcriptional regulator [Paludibacteraceae bacterium]
MARKSLLDGIGEIWDHSPVWAMLSEDERDYVRENCTYKTFRKREIVQSEGDTPTHVMVLMQGKLRVYKHSSAKHQIIRMLKPFESFSYRSVVIGGTYNTTVSAFETSVVCQIKKEVFLTIVRANSAFAFCFLQEACRLLGASDTKTVNISQKHIRGRLAEALLELKNNYGLEDDGATISMMMSREDLANLSNMTTSNAIRTLSQFSSEGLLNIDGRKIKILNLPELERLSRVG